MIGYAPVAVPRSAFRFCRVSMAALLWAGVLLRSEVLTGIVGLVMLLSAILTVRNAPMVWLYTNTLHRAFPSADDVLDKNAMRFSHAVAAVAILSPLALILLAGSAASEPAWRILLVVACFKTVGAFGFCPVSRLYGCIAGGGVCCPFLHRKAHD